MALLWQIGVSPAFALPQSGPEPIHAEYRLDENAAPGTVVETLGSVFPGLSHFRLLTDDSSPEFMVDTASGRIAVRNGAVLDYENRTLYSLAIQADVNSVREDPFLQKFAATLLDEGVTTDRLNQMLKGTKTIPVRIRLRNVAEPPRLTGDSFEIPENSPADCIVGTISAEDPDYDEELRFSILSGDDENLFVIDPISGELSVTPGRTLDYEMHPVHQLVIQVCDRDGLTANADVSVRLTNVDDEPATLIAGEKPIENLPAETSGPQSLPPVNSQPEAAGGTDPDFRTPGQGATSGAQTAVDPSDGGVPSAAGSAVADVLQQMMTNPATDPQPGPQTVRTDSNAGGMPTSPEQVLPTDATDKEAAAEDTVPAVSTKTRPQSTLARDLIVLIVILSGAGFFYARMYRQASEARQEALREKEEDEANRRSAALLLEVPLPNESERTQLQDDSNSADSEKTVSAGPKNQTAASALDPEALISEDYFREDRTGPESVRPEPPAQAGSGRPLQRTSVGHDPMLHDLKNKVDSVSHRLETEAARPDSDLCIRDEIGHETLRPVAEISEVERKDDIPRHPPGNDPNVAGDPRESLTRARENVGRMLDGLEAPATDRARSFNGKEISTGPAAAKRTGDKNADVSGEYADRPAAPARSLTAVAEPEPELLRGSGLEDDTKSSEDTHNDAVADYLSNLLERSGKGERGDNIFTDRRKSNGKWEGTDKRAKSKPAQPVKSYIESYLSEHGGQLHRDLAELQQLQPSAAAPSPPEQQQPVVRTPVDVSTIRAHMTSFREVASRSVENALVSYNRRQAKSKLAWRSVLVMTLAVMTILVIVTNASRALRFDSLNWLMGTIVVLTAAELGLRIQSIRRNRNALLSDAVEGSPNGTGAPGTAIVRAHESVPPSARGQRLVKSGTTQ